MLYPLIALPQAARISEAYKTSIKISFGNAHLVFTKESMAISAEVDWTVKKSDMICYKANLSESDTQTLYPSPLSREVSAEAINILESFAHKTYAPATEASRIAGAGAGLTDND